MDFLLPLPPAPHGTNIAQYAALRLGKFISHCSMFCFPSSVSRHSGTYVQCRTVQGMGGERSNEEGRNRSVENRLLEMGRGTGEGRGDRRIEGKEKEKRHGCRNNAPPPMSHFLDPIHTHTHSKRGRGKKAHIRLVA